MKIEMEYKDDVFVLEIESWTRIYKNDVMIATVVNEEEGRRVVWLEINDPELEYVTADMFEEVI